MIIIEIILIIFFVNEIIESSNLLWTVFNIFFLIITSSSILYSLTKK